MFPPHDGTTSVILLIDHIAHQDWKWLLRVLCFSNIRAFRDVRDRTLTTIVPRKHAKHDTILQLKNREDPRIFLPSFLCIGHIQMRSLHVQTRASVCIQSCRSTKSTRRLLDDKTGIEHFLGLLGDSRRQRLFLQFICRLGLTSDGAIPLE